tara:strand:- start:626 stop:1249 length:624 start_codon:yes stop_codon:yes gene_type:complete
MEAKICGVRDLKILDYIINHNYPPKFIGFIANYTKSKRYLKFEELKKLVKTRNNNINYVCVLVDPTDEILKKIKTLNFDYYQLYNVSPEKTKMIKKKFNIKIITALTIKNINDVLTYKNYEKISEIILFDSKGYEKSLGFDHKLLDSVPRSLKKMLAGNIQYNDKLEKFNKITDIIDISGSLETFGKKDIIKINIFLNNIKKINDET